MSHKRDFLVSTQVSVGLLFGGGDTWTADVFFCMEPAIESDSSNRPNWFLVQKAALSVGEVSSRRREISGVGFRKPGFKS